MTGGLPHIPGQRPVSLDRIFFRFLALLTLGAQLHAQIPEIRLTSTTGDTLNVRPGTLLTIPVQFENTSSATLELSTNVSAPAGWKEVGGVPHLSLGAAERQVHLITVMVPRNAPARIHSVLVVTGITGNTSRLFSLEVHVRVASVERLVAVPVESPKYTVGGEPAGFIYEVTNRGNDTAGVRFGSWNSRQYPASVDPPEARIAPLAAVRVKVGLTTSPEERTRTQLTTELLVRSVASGSEVRSAITSEVVPPRGSGELRSLTFPVVARVRAATENERRGLQGELSGSGSFREDGNDKLEFLFRSPETQTRSVLGQRDEFKLRYATGPHEIMAGDWNFAVSPLTELGRTAVGAGGRTRWGAWSAGGFVNQTRFGPPVRRQAAGWLQAQLRDDVTTGANVLHLSDRGGADVLSLSLFAEPLDNSRVEAEGGTSTGAAGSGRAFYLRWVGSLPWLSYDVRTVDATPRYAGYYRDMQFTSVNIAATAMPDVRLELSGNIQRRNVDADTSNHSAPRGSFVQVGAGYANLVVLSFRSTAVVDTLSLSPYDRQEDVVQVRTATGWPGLTVSAYAELGALTDRRRQTSDPVQRYSLTANVQATARQTYSTTLELATGREPYTGSRTERLSGSLAASYIIGQRTLASLNLFGSRMNGPLPQSFAVIDAAVEHVFPNSHRLKLQARRSTFSGVVPELALAADYAVPITVPFAQATSKGIVAGRVVDDRGFAIPRVLVSVGSAAAATDDRGEFIIADLTPGDYPLTIDRASAGLDRVATSPLPLILRIVGGERTPVVLTLVHASAVNVDIARFEHGELKDDATAPLVPMEMEGIVRIAGEMVHDGTSLRRVSDSRGRLRFTDLLPGHWTLSLDTTDLADRSLERTTIEFDLAPGSTADTTIRLLPRARRIRIIQEGGLLEERTPQSDEEPFGNYMIRKTTGGFVVEVASVKLENRARQEVARLTSRSGRRARVERSTLPDRGIVYRVIVGPFPSSDLAKQFCRSLAK